MSKINHDIVNLRFGNSLIMGNKPRNVSGEIVQKALQAGIEDIAKKAQLNNQIEKFGFFNNASPNYNTFVPGLSADDILPAEGDFIEPLFRALSEVVVHKNHNPVDFSKKGVLKKSMNLLVGQTIYPDHEPMTGNSLGAVSDVNWQESYVSTEGGILIPAGINAFMKIDAKSHPMIARGITMDPPSVHSCSVTVEFLWETSHPELSDGEFYNRLGTYDDKGELIRRIASKIIRYHEISLVPHGADPFAQKIGEDNQIVNPIYAGIGNAKLSAEEKQTNKKFFFSYKDLPDYISNSEQTILNFDNKDKNKNMNKELLAFVTQLSALIGMDSTKIESLTNDTAITAFSTEIAQLKQNASKVEELNTKITELTTEKDNLVTELTELKKNSGNLEQLSKFHDEQLEQLRTKTLSNYKLTAGDKPDTSIEGLIAKADYTALQLLNANYTTQLEATMPLHCEDCKSTNVTRMTAQRTPGSKDGKTSLSREEILKNRTTPVVYGEKRK